MNGLLDVNRDLGGTGLNSIEFMVLAGREAGHDRVRALRAAVREEHGEWVREAVRLL